MLSLFSLPKSFLTSFVRQPIIDLSEIVSKATLHPLCLFSPIYGHHYPNPEISKEDLDGSCAIEGVALSSLWPSLVLIEVILLLDDARFRGVICAIAGEGVSAVEGGDEGSSGARVELDEKIRVSCPWF